MISAAVVILTAGYILWAIQRVYLGAEYKGPHPEALTPITGRELSVAIPLVFLAILFGVMPKLVLRYMDATIDKQVQDLVVVMKRIDDEAEASEAEAMPKETAQFDPQLHAWPVLQQVEATKPDLTGVAHLSRVSSAPPANN